MILDWKLFPFEENQTLKLMYTNTRYLISELIEKS